MSKRTEELLKSLNKAGYNSSEIKEDILEKLKGYFKNYEHLKKYAFENEILSVYSFFIAYNADEEFFDGISQVLEIYNSAYRDYPDILLNMIVSILDFTTEKENQMFTVGQNLPDFKNKDFYNKVVSLFKHIGDSLEISAKYIISELYAILELIKNGKIDYEKIKKYEFGVLIQGILNQQKLCSVLKLEPHYLRLSDWRNIAYHHTYAVVSNSIRCEYGKNKTLIELTMPELEKYTHYIMRSCNILNIARCIFVFDNLTEIQEVREKLISGDTRPRKDLLVNALKVSLLSQGFEVIDYIETSAGVNLSLCDLKNAGDLSLEVQRMRIIHSSQFLYRLWQISRMQHLKIIYYNSRKSIVAESSIKGEVFQKLDLEEDDISTFAKYVNFVLFPPK